MSKRESIDAVTTWLQTAFPGSEVAYSDQGEGFDASRGIFRVVRDDRVRYAFWATDQSLENGSAVDVVERLRQEGLAEMLRADPTIYVSVLGRSAITQYEEWDIVVDEVHYRVVRGIDHMVRILGPGDAPIVQPVESPQSIHRRDKDHWVAQIRANLNSRH